MSQRDFAGSPCVSFSLYLSARAVAYRFELYATFEAEQNYFDATCS